MHPQRHGPRALAFIAAFKFLKSAVLVVAAFELFRLRNPEVTGDLVTWLRAFPLTTGHRFVADAIEWLLGVTPHKIELFGTLLLIYAGLYGVEGFGLWRNAKWAEYLTVISTGLFIPIELWEMARHFGAMKVLAFAINVAIVVYLIRLLRARHVADQGGAAGDRSDRSPVAR